MILDDWYIIIENNILNQNIMQIFYQYLLLKIKFVEYWLKNEFCHSVKSFDNHIDINDYDVDLCDDFIHAKILIRSLQTLDKKYINNIDINETQLRYLNVIKCDIENIFRK